MSRFLSVLAVSAVLSSLLIFPSSAAIEYQTLPLDSYTDFSDGTFVVYSFSYVEVPGFFSGTFPADQHSFSFTAGSKSEALITFESDVGSVGDNGGDMEFLMIPWTDDSSGTPAYFQVDYDLGAESTSLELMGRIHGDLQFTYNDDQAIIPVSSCQVIVGSSAVDVPMAIDGSGDIDFNDFIYDGTGSSFSSFSLRFYFETATLNEDSPDVTCKCIVRFSTTDFQIGHLVDDPVPGPDPTTPGLTDDSDALQSDIDDLDSMEQEFFGSMEDNFNALNIDSFTIPDGVLSGFTLVLSVFSSVWTALGTYQILFTFPLMLSIVLLIIGRISKSAGHKDSSSSSDKGGDP